ncbi:MULTISPECIES: hypothetical protein [Exiguobacterium]|uniref:Uncharacterized protein n=1 Tax=Exiguobacterium acetylicum TaxID=41170 RepID=A0ABX8GEZ6_EXIAC|nr:MULTISPECIES: hypothetical protein [Exiguobacterium]QWB31607.1 hypothetical protein KKI46_08190 [Exiguobacterium acetylicum]QZY88324.1 hypothetical protein K7G97_08310 [Exiguobacterium acetylicum]
MMPELIPDDRELERRIRIVHLLRKLGKTDEAIARSLYVSIEWVQSIYEEDDWQQMQSS